MRIPAAIVAASLTLAPTTPVEPVEQLLDDVSATHEYSITAINSAETDDEVRDVLIAWRKELIAAADELTELREEAAEDGLTEEEKATFDEATKTLKRERAGVRELRASFCLTTHQWSYPPPSRASTGSWAPPRLTRSSALRPATPRSCTASPAATRIALSRRW